MWGKTGLAMCLGALVPLAAMAAPRLEDAWVRAMPPSQSTTAAYVTVHNTGSAPLLVTGATAALAGRVELHANRHVDGMVRMERVAQLRIEPGERVALSPGGLHLMLLDLERMPEPGETVRLCLQFDAAPEACAAAAVRRSGAMTNPHH